MTMERSWYWRLALMVGLMALSIYYALPSVLYFAQDAETRRLKVGEAAEPESESLLEQLGWLPDSRINLGIDLQGGLHLVMGVDTNKAVLDRVDRTADEIVESMKEAGTPVASARRVAEVPVVNIELRDAAHMEGLKEILADYGQNWSISTPGATQARFRMTAEYEAKVRDDAVRQALTTLRNRIDKYGVAEPEIRKQGENSIMIQLAGLTADQVGAVKEDIIGKTAQLEFKLVDETSDYFERIHEDPDRPESITLSYDQWNNAEGALVRRPYLQSTDKAALRAFLAKHRSELPSDRVVGLQEVKPNAEADPVYQTWLMERRTPLTGDALTDAFVQFDSEKNEYYVAMSFDKKGAVTFERLTTNNVKRKMAIVLDDVVDSAPVIQGPIPNGRASITLGGFKSQQEILEDAKKLAIVLKAGALPAPVYPQEERTVGATLGDDAVVKGRTALLVALGGIVVIMMLYYRLSGVIGVFALVCNLICLVAALSSLGATLTLPGIAGLALTVGMAVDANIIQFERIREELRADKKPRAAVAGGFDKAFSAILDANLTTALAAVVLYQYGSGPIRGFATTLGVGVLINTVTAVLIPRLFLDYLTKGVRVSKVSI